MSIYKIVVRVYASFEQSAASIANDATDGTMRILEQFARAFSSANPFFDFISVETEFQSTDKVFCKRPAMN
jgi:hypothetical protein